MIIGSSTFILSEKLQKADRCQVNKSKKFVHSQPEKTKLTYNYKTILKQKFMKKILLVAVCGLFAFTTNAQSTLDEMKLMQSEYGLDKKQLVVELMKFSEEESAKFWPIYDKYETERMALGKSRIDNIMDYANNYSLMTDAKATELVNASLNNHISFTKLQQKTFKEMSAAITAIRAAQFIQLEVFLENVIRQAIANEIPLIKKSDEQKKN